MLTHFICVLFYCPQELMDNTAQQIRDNLPEIIEQIKAENDANRIYFYAESLELPWDDKTGLPIGKEGRPWKLMIGDEEIVFPYAHLRQRYMTYPWENPEVFWRFLNGIFFCAFAGNQFGKSVWETAWVVMECLGIHPLQKLTWKRALEMCGKSESDLPAGAKLNKTIRPKPPLSWWVVSPDLPSESNVKTEDDTALVQTFSEWTPKDQYNFQRKAKIMTIGDSSVKWFGHDQEARKLKGARVDGIGWDEEPPKSFWNEGRPRIIKKKGIFLLGMTSDYGSWTGEIRRQKIDPSYFIGEFDSLDNPFMPEEQRKKVLGSMNEQELYMRRFGKDISFKGRVFEPFAYDIHVKKPYEVSNANVTGVIVDWHPVKPIVISYIQINPNNIWYTWAENVIEDHIVGTVAQAIRATLTKPGFTVRVKKWIIDKIAQVEQIQEGGNVPKSIIQMFRGFGIYFEIGNPSFDSAHTFLCDKMKHREWYVDPSCQLHIEQFDTWGAKRYQKGNLEGTLRDMLEVEGNDTCINHVYAYNSNMKYLDAVWEEQAENTYVHPRAGRSSRLYGRA